LKNEIAQVAGAGPLTVLRTGLLAKALDFASPASWLLHLACPKLSFLTAANLS
jgi:hypothetical protein